MYKAIVIDDEKWVVKSLIATISDQNYFEITGEFYDGRLAYEYILQNKPDLAFIDVQLAGSNGLEIIQTAKQNDIPTLFIVISGHAEFAYAQKALFNNAVSYCLKPFSRNELMDSMRKAYQILEKRSLSSSRASSENDISEKNLPFIPPPCIDRDFLPPDRIHIENRLVQTMLSYLQEHYSEDLSIQDLSDLSCITPNYASQLFKKETHYTFSSYLTNLRIYQACKCLLQTNMQIFLIAGSVGFKDYFYFAKVFKSVTGYTPSSYRRQFHTGTEKKEADDHAEK